jgi:hypothetical protein
MIPGSRTVPLANGITGSVASLSEAIIEALVRDLIRICKVFNIANKKISNSSREI